MRFLRACRALPGLLLLCCAWPLSAQTPTPIGTWQLTPGLVLEPLQGPVPEWRVIVGGGGVVQPAFQGGKRYRFMPFPVVDIRYKQVAFLSDAEGLGINVLHGKTYRAGVALSYDRGRDDRDDPRLQGLRDIGFAPELKIFAAAAVLPVVVRADLRRALGGHDGYIADLEAYVPVVATGRLFAFVGPSLTLADSRYMQAYFGVSAGDAARSGLPAFRAGGGLKGMRLGASVFFQATEHWFLGADVSAERLLGSAADSPIIETRNQFALATILGYRF